MVFFCAFFFFSDPCVVASSRQNAGLYSLRRSTQEHRPPTSTLHSHFLVLRRRLIARAHQARRRGTRRHRRARQTERDEEGNAKRAHTHGERARKTKKKQNKEKPKTNNTTQPKIKGEKRSFLKTTRGSLRRFAGKEDKARRRRRGEETDRKTLPHRDGDPRRRCSRY